ncbi:M64 family metallopeptidase [Salininema proteolyticum]|uniref:M64 family metallopeptidase n=1 Tax=Salininema proteolyticum TaxID=1607685 RepID=A0ABV8TVE3_9ACTN
MKSAVLTRLTLATAGLALLAPAGVAWAEESDTPTQRVEGFAPDGTPFHTDVPVEDSPQVQSQALSDATVHPVEVNGPDQNRNVLVLIGDGYQAGEMGAFAEQTDRIWESMASHEPFASYRELFNVYRIEVPSTDSGVSGDPTEDVVRDTPLNSNYWCGGIERLLCTDTGAAWSYADLIDGVDNIAVVANSEKYGGAGYIEEDIATLAGGNEQSIDLMMHELAHSMGDLADEYDYYAEPGDGSRYDGPEIDAPNVTIHSEDEMLGDKLKWHCWIGEEDPNGGPTGAFEGAYYAEFGAFRPAETSLMKVLGAEFNYPSRQGLIEKMWASAGSLADSHTDRAQIGREVEVELPEIDTLTTTWYVDGTRKSDWDGRTSVPLTWDMRGSDLSVVITDETEDVRDQRTCATGSIQEEISWKVTPSRRPW